MFYRGPQVGLDTNTRIVFLRYLEVSEIFRKFWKILRYLENFEIFGQIYSFFGCCPAFPRYFLDRILSFIILC